MGFGIPSWSDIKSAVTNTASTATATLSGAAGSVRDLGDAALERTKELASEGVDLGRRAVNEVRSIDVREAAATVRETISGATESARDGIRTGVEWAGQKTHEAAGFARDHVPGGDNIVSNTLRGAITAQENATRFSLGVVGGVSREVVGLAGTVGELGTTVAEMQLSREAQADYGQRIVDGAKGAATATGDYVESVARDPSRLGSDISGAAGSVKSWAGGQIDRYEQSFRDGKGFETVGMDVGTVATYVVPVGGGPARGALTAAARGGTEAVARGGAELVAREGAEALAKTGGEAAARLSAADQAAIRVATADQLKGGYKADVWGARDLTSGEKVYGGLPGASPYYTDAATLAASGENRVSLFQSLQVQAHPEFGYRPVVGEYEVVQDMRVPFGTVAANPEFGVGGGSQFFVENYGEALRLVREIPLGE